MEQGGKEARACSRRISREETTTGGYRGEEARARLQQPCGLVEDRRRVERQLAPHLEPGEVGLQKHVGLDVRVVEARLGDGQWAVGGQVLQRNVLAVPDGKRVELSSG